jgi:hypothetical protein
MNQIRHDFNGPGCITTVELPLRLPVHSEAKAGRTLLLHQFYGAKRSSTATSQHPYDSVGIRSVILLTFLSCWPEELLWQRSKGNSQKDLSFEE